MGTFTSTPIGGGSQSYYVAATPTDAPGEPEERLQLQEHIADELLKDDTRALLRIDDDGSPHTTTNAIIDVDEERGTATSRSVYVVFQAVDGFALQPIITGRYHDRFDRVDGAWRFAERVFVAGLQGDLAAHQVLDDHPIFDEDGQATRTG